MTIAVSLIALALGYKVYIDASKEKEGLRLLGQAIGILVLIGSLLTFAGGIIKCVKYGCPKGFYGKTSSSCVSGAQACKSSYKKACASGGGAYFDIKGNSQADGVSTCPLSTQ